MQRSFFLVLAAFVWAAPSVPTAQALEYPYAPYNAGRMDPQKTGWPLTDAERAYVLKPEHERRPGRESNQHKPPLWPVTPSAGHWGGTSWLDTHAKLVETVKANQGPVDILLVGDSITMQWGAAWQKHFGQYKSVNIGIGGDKTQNVLWRLDHGGGAGIEPRLAVLLIGNNNMFFTPETGIEPAAQGIKVCVDNLREKFPQAPVVVVKIFPAHAPGNRFYEDIKKTNAALDSLTLDSDPKVHVLDLWNDMVKADGTLKKGPFTPDNIHLTQDGGYELYASKLKPLVEAVLGGKPLPAPAANPKRAAEAAPSQPAPRPGAVTTGAPPAVVKPTTAVNSARVLTSPYAPYNEGKMDPQITGWPLTDDERAWVKKEEYTRKPGHEAQKHLPAMWAVTPTASHWKTKDGSASNAWIDHHATCIEKVQAARDAIDIALIGDRTENVLWRLDHGALDGASPKIAVLLIGTNNTPLVGANGVPAESVAQGIQLCVQNLRARCPKTHVIVVKVLPAGKPGNPIYEAVKNANKALDALKLDADANVHVLDLWSEFTNADGSLKTAAYSDGHLHLGAAGYEIYASKLKPRVDKLLGGQR